MPIHRWLFKAPRLKEAVEDMSSSCKRHVSVHICNASCNVCKSPGILVVDLCHLAGLIFYGKLITATDASRTVWMLNFPPWIFTPVFHGGLAINEVHLRFDTGNIGLVMKEEAFQPCKLKIRIWHILRSFRCPLMLQHWWRCLEILDNSVSTL